MGLTIKLAICPSTIDSLRKVTARFPLGSLAGFSSFGRRLCLMRCCVCMCDMLSLLRAAGMAQ